MTRRFPRLLAAIFLLTSTVAFAQKDMGPAAQYYGQQTHPKFKFAPGPKKTGGDITWVAHHQELEKDEYAILEGAVVVNYQDMVIHADKATVNLKTKDVVAQGHVIMDQGPSRLTADNVVFNLDSKLGTLFHATGTMEPSLYFTGDKLEKVDVDRYILTNGIFTSCDLNRPSWSFHVKRADITLNDYAHMQDLSFRAHEVPVFWAPRLIWPTKRDRSQGFLIPRIGFSTDFGERIETGYFIPFGDSADATLYADLNTKGYNGFGVDLRYLPTPDIKLGELSADTVRNKAAGRQEWHYQYRHAQDNLPGGFRGVVDVEDLSNIDFFRDYDRDPRIHTLSQLYSSAYLTKNRPTYSFNILTDRRDLFGAPIDPTQPPPRQRFEQLPSRQFRMYPIKMGETPLYFSLESSGSHLVTS